MSPPPAPSPEGDDPVHSSPSLHWSHVDGWSSVEEPLAVEAPLAIEIAYQRAGHEVRKVLAVTMRTPGHDEELALGFLFAEGLIGNVDDIAGSARGEENARGEKTATQRVQLVRPPREDLQRVSRGLLTSSACGVCGRVSLDGLPARRAERRDDEPELACEILARLPDALRRHQPVFFATGGSHGAALCDLNGAVVITREDVGRHNAVDKLIGAALQRRLAPARHVLVLSGRASFELVQKAAAFGLAFVVAVGAPSSLAVSVAHAAGITLVGFTRDGRFNVYTHADRLNLAASAAPRSHARTAL